MENQLNGNPEKAGKKEDGRAKTWFKKGQSGNPAGKPPGTISVVSLIKRVLQERAKTTDGTDKERIEVLARNIVAMAIQNADKDMIKLIVSYVDGMPTEKFEGDIEVKMDVNIKKAINKIYGD